MHTPGGLSFDCSPGALANFSIINGLAHLLRRAVCVGTYVPGSAPSTSIDDKPLNPHSNSEKWVISAESIEIGINISL